MPKTKSSSTPCVQKNVAKSKPWDPTFEPSTPAELDMHFLHLMEWCEGQFMKHVGPRNVLEAQQVHIKLQEAADWAKRACHTLMASGVISLKLPAICPGHQVEVLKPHPHAGGLASVIAIEGNHYRCELLRSDCLDGTQFMAERRELRRL